MIEIDVPGYRNLQFGHLVADYNGTLATDGLLLEGVRERLESLSKKLTIHVVTADTFGKVQEELQGVPCKVSVLPSDEQDKAKLAYVRRLGAESVVAIGNGRNDRPMLAHAAVGITVVQGEGATTVSLLAADIVCPDVLTALDLLLNPMRIVATLRS